jgi:superfamily II DNA or RNA helicase
VGTGGVTLTHRQGLLYALATEIPEYLHLPVPIRDALLSEVVLRDYQLDLLQRAAALMRQGYRRVLIVLPTGGGKTLTAGQALLSAVGSGFTGQFVVHRKELLDQTSDSFNAMGLTHGFIAAGRPLDLTADMILAGVQTLANRLHLVLPPDLGIVDEAQHATAATWARVMEAYPDAYILGLTAAPERLDGRGLGDHFDAMVIGPSVAELIERGFLSPYDYFAPSRPDLSGVHTVAGDFNKAEVEAVMDRPELVGDIVQHYLRLAAGQRGIVFAASREHSRNIAEAFRAAGIRAEHVDGSTPDRERARIDADFRSGAIDIMTNVDLFGEGYDVPGIVYCGLARPTKSLSLFMQQCGRALRTAPGKKRAIICDHAGNAFTHGLPDDPREWTLEGRAPRVRVALDDAEPIHQCPECFRAYPSVLPACPGCGVEKPATSREIKQREGELEKLEREAMKRRQAEERAAEKERLALEKAAATRARKVARKAEEDACTSCEDFENLARARGYDKPVRWSQMKMAMRTSYSRFRR